MKYENISESAAISTLDMISQRVLPRERQSAVRDVRCLKRPFRRVRLPLSQDKGLYMSKHPTADGAGDPA